MAEIVSDRVALVATGITLTIHVAFVAAFICYAWMGRPAPVALYRVYAYVIAGTLVAFLVATGILLNFPENLPKAAA